MRIRLRWIIAIGIAAALVCGGADAWRRSIGELADRMAAARTGQPAVASQTYLLAEDRWLDFKLPDSGDLLRVLTNANFRPGPHLEEVPQTPRPGWSYALEYQLLDADGSTLDGGRYHFRTRLTEYRDPRTGEQITPVFYADDTLVTAGARAMLYPLRRLPAEADRLQLKLHRRDAAIVEVAVRVYCRQQRRGYLRAYRWRRTSRKSKEKICRGSVYPPELLSGFEKRNSLRWQWNALAPRGMEGREYRRRILYTLEEIVGEEVDDAQAPAGMPVDRNVHAMVALPERLGGVTLHCVPFNPPLAKSETADLEVRFYGDQIHQRSVRRFSVTPKKSTFELPAEGGLLEIRSPRTMALRVFRGSQGRAGVADLQEITPQPSYLRTYLADARQTIEYDVVHLAGRSTPFRIALRRPVTAGVHRPGAAHGVGGNSAPVQWELLDARGNVIRRGTIGVDRPVSMYDRVEQRRQELRVTDAADYYFSLPAQVRRVRFRPQRRPVLMAAYTRPPDLEKVTRVPEDYRALEPDQPAQRTWFPLRPAAAAELIEQQRAVTLVIQPRPPRDRPELISGDYGWEDFHPQGPWKARHLLTPRPSWMPVRREAARTTYCRLEPGRQYRLAFFYVPGQTQVTPQLIYRTEAPLPQELQVHVNGRTHDRFRIHAPQGQLTLCPLPVRGDSCPTRLRIVAGPSTQVFLSGVTPPVPPTYLKRLANSFQDGRLEFEYHKRAARQEDEEEDHEEVLSLRLFRRFSSPGRTRLDVEILTADTPEVGPYRSWTLTRRQYDVLPAGGEPVMVLGTADELVHAGQPCFLPLGSDLPPGKYTIRASCPEDDGGYLILSKITPPVEQRRTIFTQQHLDPQTRQPGAQDDATAID